MLNYHDRLGLSQAAGILRAVLGGFSLFAAAFLVPVFAETPVLPLDQWANTDIGTTPAAGSGIYSATSGTYTIKGSGADIWGTSDNFHYAYQPLSGDGVIVARVSSLTNTNVWAKAGVMIREALTPGSKYAMMMITPGNGTGLQYRIATSGSSVNVMTTGVVAPRWLKLERRGNVLSGYQSADGVTWVLSQRIALAMTADVYVGFAACSHVTTSTLTTAVFDQILLDPTNVSMALPWPWTESAIGTSTNQGVALYDGSYVLSNLGADIWSPADKLKFVSKSLTSDGTLIIKVASIASADSWTRLGLMMRESLNADAKNVLLSLTTGNGLVFQSRQTTAGATAFRSSSVAKTPPVWLKLDRSGNTFTAAYSADGAIWTVQGTETIAMNASIQVGVAYANRSTSTWAFGVGDQLKLVTPLDADGNGLPDVWELRYFGGLGVAISADADGDGLTNAQEWELGTNPIVATPSGQRPVLALIGGDNQSAATGSVLPQPLVVKVTDANTGEPLAGVPVTFQFVSGQGLLGSDPTWQPAVELISDVDGLAQTQLQFSSFGGTTTVQASIGTQPGVVTFSFKALLGSPGSSFLLDTAELGTLSKPGAAQYQNGNYTLTAAGGDIWNKTDSFRFAWRTLSGDGLFVARLTSLNAGDPWSMAGLMIRETLDPTSRNASLLLTPGNGVAFRWRDAVGVNAAQVTKPGVVAPGWLALRRSGAVISGYYSADGITWTQVGKYRLAMAQNVYVGLAYANLNASFGQAVFDSLRMETLAPGLWQVADVGLFNAGNIDEFTANTMMIRAGGVDIGGTSDNFRYVYQPMSADGSVVVRVAEQANTNSWAKSGVMIRESSDVNSRFVIVAQTPGYGVSLQARTVTGASAYVVSTLAGPVAPNWLKLERLGATVNAYESADAQTWIKVGSVNWGYAPSLIGLAVSSLNTSVGSATLFDNLEVNLFSGQRGWSASYYTNADLSGQPVTLRRDAAIDFSWAAGQAPAPGVPTANYSVRWEGSLQPQTSDTYTFTALSTGGVRLWVDGQLVIDRWALQSAASEVSGQVVLTAGTQPKVVVEYFNGADAGRIQLRWSSATLSDNIIPAGSVLPSDSDNDGIPDAWEAAHGLSPLDSTDAMLAPDGDGLTNAMKYRLGITLGEKTDRVPGYVVSEEWRSLSGVNLSDLTNSTRFSGSPDTRTLLTSLETVPNHADNYGERIRGYIVAPTDGAYQFWIAGDDSVELWLSSSDSPFDRKRIARNTSWTAFRAYDAQSAQKSALITLQAGHYYYFEVLHKEGGGGDHLSVAWRRPDAAQRELLTGTYLATFASRADDADGDGLPDAWEIAHGISATVTHGVNGAYGDFDSDTLTNLTEYQLGTSPDTADTDSDGLPDGWEISYGLAPTDASDAHANADSDSLDNLAEYQAGTDPTKSDTDGDGIPDDWELSHGLNPLVAADALADPDNDGLSNAMEYQLGTDMNQWNEKVRSAVVVEQWNSLTGSATSSLTDNVRFPSQPSTKWLLRQVLDTGINRADNYGIRIRGYLVPPVDGAYKFWVSGDDQSVLYLSPSESPFERSKIAWVDSYTAYQSFDQYATQASRPVTLQAGHYYYFEVLQKEGGGSDHVSVAWQIPGQARAVITGQYFASFTPRADDADGDGLPDDWKMANGLDTSKGFGINGAYGDPDGDGLNNLAEYQAHTNPNVADTDGDTFSDQIEILTGYDPLNSASGPGGIDPWIFTNVGVLTGAGEAVTASDGGYLILGNGSGVSPHTGSWVGGDDAYRFLHQTVSGDFEFSVRVRNAILTSGTGGIAVRDGNGATAASVALVLDSSNQVGLYARLSSSDKLGILQKNSAVDFTWLKLRRHGDSVSAYCSADGVAWTFYGSVSLSIPSACEVGMIAWNGGTTAAAQRFDHITLRLDTDGDGLYDDEELAAGSNPNVADTDGDGISDLEEIRLGTDPLVPDVVARTLATYAGSSGVTTTGSWLANGDGLVSVTPLAAMEFEITVPADGVYRLEFDLQSGGNTTVNNIYPVEISMDGQFIDRIEAYLLSGQTSLVHVTTPWVKSGVHRVRFFYDNTYSYRYVQVNALRLQVLDGMDSDSDGVADWEANRLGALNGLTDGAGASYTSPVCIEGVSRFLSLLRLTAAGENIPVTAAPGYGWYADVPLPTSGTLAAVVSFENDARTETRSLSWKTLNLLTGLDEIPDHRLRIRKGDSLLLTASPQQGNGGSAVITLTPAVGVPVVLTLNSPASTPVAHRFDSPGLYTIQGIYSPNDDPKVSSVLSVEVVEAAFNGDPIVGINAAFVWNNPLIPSGVFIETDQGLNLRYLNPLPAGGSSFTISSLNVADSLALVRLAEHGPILDHATVRTMRVASDERTGIDVLAVYPDGSRLIGTPIMVSNLTPDTRVEVEIFVNGVTFEDGTTLKVFTAADFDALGRVYVKFIYPAGLKTSFCHRVHVYRGDTYLGTF